MAIDPEILKDKKSSIEVEMGEIALQIVRIEKASEALAWEEKLLDTLNRGGAATAPFPYDIEGAWRLVEINSDSVVYKPVIARDELPEGIRPLREVVDVEALATGQCSQCEETVPLIGSSTSVTYGMGDVASKSEVALVHCDSVQLQTDESGRLLFSLHIKPEGIDLSV